MSHGRSRVPMSAASSSARRRYRRITLMGILIGVLALTPAQAHAWSPDGDELANDNSNEVLTLNTTNGFRFTTVCPDGGTGLIGVYLKGGDIRINRLSETSGNKMWGIEGVEVTDVGTIADQNAPAVESDRHGGAWVVWRDARIGAEGLYVQRYDSTGVAQFAAGGIRIGTLEFGTFAIDARTDGELLVAFEQTDVRYQRVALNGTLRHAAAGIAMTAQNGDQVQLLSDGADGAVVSWTSLQPIGTGQRTGIFANRVAGNGSYPWTVNGITVRHTTLANANQLTMVRQDTTYYFSWEDVPTNGSPRQVRAQKVIKAGALQWSTLGIVVFTVLDTPFDQITSLFPQIAATPGGGAVIGWLDGRDFTRLASNGFAHREDIYAQRLDGAGTLLWGANGAAIDTMPGTQNSLRMVETVDDGAIFVYRDFLGGNFGDIHGKRHGPSGAQVWSRYFATESGNNDVVQERPSICSDGAGGVLAAWEDERDEPTNGVDIYATHRGASNGQPIAPTITLQSPNGGEQLHSLEPVLLTWSSANLGGSLVRVEYTVGGGPRQLAVGAEANPTTNDGGFVWHVADVASSAVKVFVTPVGISFVADSSNAVFGICRTMTPAATRSVGANSPGQVASGDFDRNGVRDLAVATGTGGLHVLFGGGAGGNGDGTFPADSVVATGFIRGVAIADYNEDGNLDLTYDDNTGMFVRFGNGAGTPRFGPPVSVASGVAPNGRLWTADFDSDGIHDLVWGVGYPTAGVQARVLRGLGADGLGNGTFAAPVTIPGGWVFQDLVIADFNEDDALDLGILGTSHIGGSWAFIVHLGLKSGRAPTGAFGAATTYNFSGAVLRAAAGDFDRDGILDVAISGGAEVRILRGQGSGGIGNGTFVSDASLPMVSGKDVVVGDLNDDGEPDLLVGRADDSVVTFYGPYPFTPGGALTVPGDELALGDFLEDGQMDAAAFHGGTLRVFTGGCASALSTAIDVTSLPHGKVLVYGIEAFHTLRWTKGPGVIAVDVAVSRDAGASWEAVARGLNGIAYEWRIVGPPSNNVRVRVSDATVHNRFADNDGDLAVCVAFGAPLALSSPAKLTGVAIGDYNEDGYPDLAFSGADNLHVRLSDGAGGYGANRVESTPTGNNRIVTGDFDDDGILDLMSTTSNGVRLTRGSGASGVGDGDFVAPVTINLGREGAGLAAADLNEDGILDVVVAHPADDSISVLLGNGTNGDGNGTFTVSCYAVGDQPQRVVIADFKEDGMLDIAVTNRGSGTVSVLLGTGGGGKASGVFSTAVSYPAGTNPLAIIVGDANLDDAMDILVSNDTAPGAFTVLPAFAPFGGGQGTFQAPVATATIQNPQELVLTELNDDGYADVIALSATRDSLYAHAFVPGVILGVMGTHPLFDRRATADNPVAAAVADLDLDKVPDLAIATVFGGAQVMLGPCPEQIRLSPTLFGNPMPGSSQNVGTSTVIGFSPGFQRGPVDVDISYDGGANWEPVARNLIRIVDFGLGTAPWTVTPPATANALVRICESHATTRCDTTDAVFSIVGGPLDAPVLLPAVASLSAPWPNPMRQGTSLRLALPRQTRVMVEVFDVVGRRVRTLAHESLGAGWHTLTWDGRSDAGAPVHGGMYLLRVRGEGLDVTRRVIRAR